MQQQAHDVSRATAEIEDAAPGRHGLQERAVLDLTPAEEQRIARSLLWVAAAPLKDDTYFAYTSPRKLARPHSGARR